MRERERERANRKCLCRRGPGKERGKGRRREGLHCSTPVRKCDRPRPAPSIPPSSPLQRLLSSPLSRDHLLGGRCSPLHRGVQGVSARRPPPRVGRSAGGFVQVPAGLRVHRRREPRLGAAGETRLDPLSDAGDAGSDRATEHLLGHHRHSLRWDP